jgi:RHS repeat-associated protein
VQLLNGSNPRGVTANLLTGLRTDEYFTTSASGGLNFMSDALGSTMGLVNSSGSIVGSDTYQPFGKSTASGTATTPFQFTGRENDGTGLFFYRARYYSPTYQRFIAQDPIDFRGGINLYAYAINNPIIFGDQLGLCPTPGISPNFVPCLINAGASYLIIAPLGCGVLGYACLQVEAPGLNVPACKVALPLCLGTVATVAACAAGTRLPEF